LTPGGHRKGVSEILAVSTIPKDARSAALFV
jgi:hypothetical protein